MDISVQQMPLVERALFAVHLCGNITRTQVVQEESLHHDASFLDAAWTQHQQYNHGAYAYHQRIGESGQIVDDIEDEAQGNDVSHEYREE